jgi:hypothetical protein
LLQVLLRFLSRLPASHGILWQTLRTPLFAQICWYRVVAELGKDVCGGLNLGVLGGPNTKKI